KKPDIGLHARLIVHQCRMVIRHLAHCRTGAEGFEAFTRALYLGFLNSAPAVDAAEYVPHCVLHCARPRVSPSFHPKPLMLKTP
ncbi:MAG: hypothetical protein LBD67_08655, partial [Candidatus Accumulibacter sp.]|nr:hypothetical protein [Accumulibacter sp.]